ncbi:hypothetical protein GQ600_18975 [Phytophthora cactorum]|nr:hypothetical protein GQ600_18975 [Phytophthora cactorum]
MQTARPSTILSSVALELRPEDVDQELLHACRGYARLCDSPCTKPRRGDHGQDGLLFWREADGEQWHSRYAERLSLHGNFEGISKDLFELNAINRKRFIVQITVWDAKKRVGFPRSTPWRSAQGRYTSSSKYTLWGFTLRSLREQVDGRRRVDRVVQKAVPVLKHKGERTPSDRKGKARALAMFDAEEEKVRNQMLTPRLLLCAPVVRQFLENGEDVNVCWC